MTRTQFYLIIIGALTLMAASCAQSIGELIVGTPEPKDYSYTIGSFVDGDGKISRFLSIQDIAIDNKGNLFVNDLDEKLGGRTSAGNGGLIRKITEDKRVTTILGNQTDEKNVPSPLIGSVQIKILGNFLYFTSAGCLLRLDISSQITSHPEVVIGACLTLNQAKTIDKNPDNPEISSDYTIRLMSDLGHQELYAFDSSKKSSPVSYVIYQNGQSEVSTKFRRAYASIIDSKGYFYYILGTEATAPRKLKKIDQNMQGFRYPGDEQVLDTAAFTLDSRDNLYLIDEGKLKLINPQGNVTKIGALSEKAMNAKNIAIDENKNIVYFSDATAIYKKNISNLPK